MKRTPALASLIALLLSLPSFAQIRPVAPIPAGVGGAAGAAAAAATAGSARTTLAGPAIDFGRAPARLVGDFRAATGRLNASLAAIAAVPAEQATFANTFKAYEQATAAWGREIRAVGFMAAVSPDARVRRYARKLDKIADDYGVALSLREDLYTSMLNAAAKNETLDKADALLRDDTLKGFRENGLGLPPEQREKFKAMQNRLNELGQAFEKNINEKKDYLEVGPEALQGLPAGMVKTLEESKTPEGRYRVPVDEPSYVAFMRYSESDSDRKAMLMKYQNKGGSENVQILREALTLRRDVARMLGYKGYPEMALRHRMAKTPEDVFAFLGRVKDAVLGRARQDLADLLEIKRQKDPNATEVDPWERSYLARRLRQQRYALDPEAARPYFPLDRVAQGTMNVYQKVLGVSFREIKDAKAWAPGVRLFEIADAKTGARIGHFYLDLTPRDGKRGHPAAYSIVPGRVREDGSYEEPVSAMVGDFTPAAPGQPQLLSHDEVETFFHEFGHLMHQTLTDARYASYSGSSVARDFVEAPSQMLENFVWERVVLDELSGHWQTGEKLPEELFQKMRKARAFLNGTSYAGQVALAMGDMVLHRDVPEDVSGVFNKIMEEYTGVKVLPGTNFVAGFGHLFGYASGYYGYLWSKVFAEDIYTFFKADGVVSPRVGARYRREILAWGSERPEKDSLKAFEGREPSEDAFMRELKGEAAPAPTGYVLSLDRPWTKADAAEVEELGGKIEGYEGRVGADGRTAWTARAALQGPALESLKTRLAGVRAEEAATAPADGVVLQGTLAPETFFALTAAMRSVGPLPAGVAVQVIPHVTGNPQIRIAVDGVPVYWEYLYHSEANLGRLRRTWWNPFTWFGGLGKPSEDLSKRFAAVLTLAKEGTAVARAKLARGGVEPSKPWPRA